MLDSLNLTLGILDPVLGLGSVEELISGTTAIGSRLIGRSKDHRQVYLIGNPAVWWPSSIAIAVYLVIKAFSILRWQRGYKDYSNRIPPSTNVKLIVATWRRYDWAIGVTVLGWALHYLPFFLMERQLFLHHYFPALYFAVLGLCQAWDFLTTRSRFLEAPRRAAQITLVFLVVVIAVFSALQPIAYGGKWTKSLCERAQIFSTWDFDCDTFYPDVPPHPSPRLEDQS
jgi:dolichyl-phosphate-mannose-protein mannosyltransferase